MLQCDGCWVHLWCVVGCYVNVSIFDVVSNDELHEFISGLLLFLYMEIWVMLLVCYLLDIGGES